MDRDLILHRYRPLADLGTGGHGSVVLAFDTRMARRVAIKRLPLADGAMPGGHSRPGLAEARTAALLNHPAIVTVYEWDATDDEALIVMEDVGGASLADVLDESDGRLGPDATAAVVQTLASALSFAHENGVLHLDLKPGNVLLAHDGRVKLADFGIAALTGPGGRASGWGGTIGYMPPEQIRGDDLDERSDIWALAALAYELLTGANPFDADTLEGSLFKIEMADVPLPSEFVASLPAGVDDVLLAALAPDPSERYLSVAGFARALLPHLGDPVAGHAILAELVSRVAGPPVTDDGTPRQDTFWERHVGHTGVARRMLAAAVCAWLAWSGIGVFDLGSAATVSATSLIGLSGLLAPALGLALGLGSVIAGLLWTLGPLPAAGFALVAAVFWLLVGRRGTGCGLAPWTAPLLGSAYAAPALPLLLGFACRPLQAALGAVASGLTVTAVSLLAGSGPPYLSIPFDALASPLAATGAEGALPLALPGPGLLVALAAWPLSALVCSAACSRPSRVWASVGAVLGALVLLGGYWAWETFFDGRFPLLDAVPHVLVAAIVAGIVISLGPPPAKRCQREES